MIHDLPTPPEIAEIPELAPLSVLHVALETSVRALVAAHPELEEEALPHGASAAARCAERLLGHAYKLKLLLASYRNLAQFEDSLCGEEEIRW